jgi:hypothetical protein
MHPERYYLTASTSLPAPESNRRKVVGDVPGGSEFQWFQGVLSTARHQNQAERFMSWQICLIFPMVRGLVS